MTHWSHVVKRILDSELGDLGSVLVFLFFIPSLKSSVFFFFFFWLLVSLVKLGKIMTSFPSDKMERHIYKCMTLERKTEQWASLVVQLVKNRPARRESWV